MPPSAVPHTDAHRLQDAFETLTRIYSPDTTTHHIRRHIVHDLQRQQNAQVHACCASLRHVDATLAALASETRAMADAAHDTMARIHSATTASSSLLDHAATVQTQRATATLHHTVATRLLAQLTLSPADTQALDSDIGPRFFQGMDRLHAILDASLLLLNTHDGADTARATQEVRAKAHASLEHAYKRLAHWTSAALRRLPIDGAEISPTLTQAIARLAARQDAFRAALAAFSEKRAAMLPDAFMRALTTGGPPPLRLPRPMEIHAHDPVRYVSDMLAYTHQTLAGERELVTALVADLAHATTARWIGQPYTALDVDIRLDRLAHDPRMLDALVRSVLDRTMAGCCRSLQARILETVRLQTDAPTVLRLYFVLCFYSATLQQTIGARAALSTTLHSMAHTTQDVFVQRLQQYTATNLDILASDAHTALAASTAAARLLRSLYNECADGAAADLGEQYDAQHDQVATHLLDPLRTTVLAYAASMREPRAEASWTQYLGWGAHAAQAPWDTAPWHADTFLLNALVPLLAVLGPFAHTQAAALEQDALDAATRLYRLHASALEREAGMDSEGTPDAEKLHEFLRAPTLLSVPPRLHAIAHDTIASAIHRAALAQLANVYTQRPHDDPRLSTNEELRILLVVDGAQAPQEILADALCASQTW
ncbi:Cog6p [Malassezia vespertilionis]|uniref:Conserved oligomeric Golgi complex subunit 6 n=1 Tax=Malassezia vespertilionis TaxID=2020962 RepID=A0A2N1J7F8_9BASI|nr:Cog6p [Malassezia vespertilionis]